MSLSRNRITEFVPTIPDPKLPEYDVEVSIRIFINSNRIRKFPDRFRYELPGEDKQYEEMYKMINSFHEHLALPPKSSLATKQLFAEARKRNDDHLRQLPNGSIVIYKVGPNDFHRAKILKNHFNDDEGKKFMTIGFVDQEAAPFQADLRDIYGLRPHFSFVAPRVRYLRLVELDFYTHLCQFGKIILSVAEDTFGGEFRAKFVETRGDISYKLRFMGFATAKVYGPKFPEESFPLGLNGFLVNVCIQASKEPLLPKLHLNRSDTLVLGLEENGDAFVTFCTPIYEHYLHVIERANSSKVLTPKMGTELSVVPNEIYLAPYSDGYFYRAMYKVEDDEELHLSSSEMIKMYFIDYGSSEVVKRSALELARDVDPYLCMFPPMAIKVHLSGVNCIDVNNSPDMSGFFCVKTLKTSLTSGTGIPEVEIRRIKNENTAKYDTFNEEIVKTIGDGELKETEDYIKSLRYTCRFNAHIMEDSYAVNRQIINTHWLFWNHPSEPIELFEANKKYDVLLFHEHYYDPIILWTPPPIGSVVLIPPKRVALRNKMEQNIQRKVNRGRDWRFGVELGTALRHNRIWGCVIDDNHFVRIKLMATWADIQKTVYEHITRKFLRAYLVDYGVITEIRWRDIFRLDDEDCRYSPFAIQATIKDHEGFSTDLPKADSVLLRHFIGDPKYIRQVKVVSIWHDTYDIPHAVIQFVFNEHWLPKGMSVKERLSQSTSKIPSKRFSEEPAYYELSSLFAVENLPELMLYDNYGPKTVEVYKPPAPIQDDGIW